MVDRPEKNRGSAFRGPAQPVLTESEIHGLQIRRETSDPKMVAEDAFWTNMSLEATGPVQRIVIGRGVRR